MKRTIVTAALAFALGFNASASEFLYDFSSSGEAVDSVPAFAVGDKLLLSGPGGVSLSLDIVSAPPAGIAGQSFIAKDGATGAGAVVKFGVGKLRITVDDFAAGKIYTFVVKDGKKSFSSLDKVQEPDECATCAATVTNDVSDASQTETPAVKTVKKSPVLKETGSVLLFAAQKSVVDILVAFDQGAKVKCTQLGFDSIEEFADYAVAKMNTVLANSQLDDKFCYRLVGVVEIDDKWSAINGALLGSLRASEGKLAKISQLREKFGADTTTLLIDKTSGTTTGIAYGYYLSGGYDVPSKFDTYAYNVCDINTVYSRYTMSHETGHNMGCGHSNRQGSNSGPGRYSDSCGYHFADANNVLRGTVMAYTYSGDNDGYYNPVPYFSTPEISPSEYGCALGVEGVNNNRGTLLQTYDDIAGLREHMLPYDWDVRFVDDSGNDIADGSYFYSSCYVTLTNSNPAAEIYYTLDRSTPTTGSLHGGSGTNVYMYLVTGPKTLTACAVVDGVAQSVRSITLHDGLTWSGDSDGNGLWLNNDSYVLPWTGNSYFSGDAVMFPDLAGVSCATVTVKGAVAPGSVAFSSIETAYAFDGGDDDAKITIPNANFAPSGDVTFNVPVQLSATTFTNMTGCALTFNAPFGQIVDENSGSFTTMINIAPSAIMTVAPGVGKTQALVALNTNGWHSGTSTFRVGEGTVVLTGAINGGRGVIGRTKLEVGNGGELVFNMGGGTGYQMDQTSLTIEKGGAVIYNNMEHLRRTLFLSGGTIYAKRLDLMGNPGVYVTDNSAIENNGGGYILIRNSDSEINVSDGKSLILNVGIQTDNRSDTSGWGIVKRGGGTLAANAELKHSGVTDIEAGALAVGYSSGTALYGLGWIVASNATLKVNSGCSLKVPMLTLDEAATISVSAASEPPIVATNDVSVSGVYFELAGADNLAAGASYPLLKGNAGISDAKNAKTSRLPELAKGLKWQLEVSNNTLYAKVVEKSAIEEAVPFVSNDLSLALAMPDDATVAEGGGARIAASPIVLDGLSTKAVSIAVKVVVPESSPSDVATICSWRVGDYKIYCVRETTGKLNCRWIGVNGSLGTTANQTNDIVLATGEHLLQIGYYSNGSGGTRVLLDGKVAYVATGLVFSGESVNSVTFGATAEDSPRYPYAGLVIREAAVLDILSDEPAPHMTASGGSIAYGLNVPGVIPRVFPLAPSGALALDETVVEATFGETTGEASVSVMASFPSDAVGTVCGMWVQQGAAKCGLQAEYDGGGKFYIRSADNSLASYPAVRLAETSLDVSKPHLYTLTFKSGDGVAFYQDGVALLKETSLSSSYNTVISPVTFGCGPYHFWRGSSLCDYPNPAKDFSLYASHIALGTSDRAVSEAAVMASMATDGDDPEPPETPATVDVLVAYDNGAQAYVANKGVALSEFAATQIEKMNAVLATNRLDRYYSYRLAGVCKVNGVYDNIDTAPALIAAGTGSAVSLRAARELYGADTVTLLVDVTGNTLGNSSPLNYPYDVASQHECAFSVCSIRAVDTGKQHTMIHENAHNMGCGHARKQNIINSPFEYGRGFYFKDGNVTRHTIMAYGGDNDASWYFSTTSTEFGFMLGDATNDNARVLRETCGEVAKWRDGAAIELDGSFSTGNAVWQTGRKYPWFVEGDAIRSFNQTDYQYQCTTPLKATIIGPKVLRFKYKSYFGGVSVAGNNYSHFDVLLDDSPVITQTECTNSWTDAQVDIPEGTHEVVFVFSQRFAMNDPEEYKDGTPETDDAVWIKDIQFVERRIIGAAAVIR
ncbi:MAG: chitobiase/beta-hexosaminidase C-terminal domain-containing protein [Kiritimatiellae bacterium]|nr:chitobiase/beta-hexosaminidase C-terminal domain-containing protein [Kiritimatiellia bacterium]